MTCRTNYSSGYINDNIKNNSSDSYSSNTSTSDSWWDSSIAVALLRPFDPGGKQKGLPLLSK
jgi:hypothetical protein